MQEVNQKNDQELDEMLRNISAMTKKIKKNPEQVALLCIETGMEIFERLGDLAKQTIKDKLSEFLSE